MALQKIPIKITFANTFDSDSLNDLNLSLATVMGENQKTPEKCKIFHLRKKSNYFSSLCFPGITDNKTDGTSAALSFL